MKITIETSGGFAPLPALSRPSTTDTAALSPAFGAELESLVHGCAFFDQPAIVGTPAKGAADHQTHRITVQDGAREHTVQLADPISNPALERLVTRLQSLNRVSGP